MRLVRHYRHGPPSVLTVDDVERPTPSVGQVLIQIEAVGVNTNAAHRRRGAGPRPSPLPGAPGGDVVGTVVDAGPAVTSVVVGDRVVAIVPDAAYADYTVADAGWLLPIPADLDPVLASMLGAPSQVALTVLQTGRLVPGERILVHGAGGAIGHMAVQLARLLGAASVAATAGSPAKVAYARMYGAHLTVNYTNDAWADTLAESVGGNGFDVIANGVGGATIHDDLRLLAPFGRLVWYGAAGGQPDAVPPARLTNPNYLAGSSFAAWRIHRPDQVRANLRQLIDWAVAGRLGTTTRAIVALAEAERAHTLVEDRSGTGRIVIVPDPVGPPSNTRTRSRS